MISAFKKNGIQVVICTNGLPLGNKEMSSWLINSEVEAVSVSLDSHEPEYNDKWRKDPSGGGWQQVVKGIQTLMEERERANSRTRVGIYSVITSLNIDHILKTALFVNKLGVDYLIIQPVSLVKEHRLHDVLSLSSQHHEVLSETLDLLMKSPLKIRLPNDLYLQLILHSLQDDGVFPQVRSCFGGKNLFFIEPDGSIWDCPSVFKIAKTPPEQFRSIQDQSVVDLFLTKRLERNTDCSLFSQDCVNMWQLMAFDDIIN
jgi:sulfatase maturation enzyme AslB (radical SAM superfamily)